MFTVLCKVSKHMEPAEYELQKGAGPPFLPLHCPKKKERISPCHSYSSKRKLLLFVKEALKSSDMKGKSSLREEGHGVREEIKGTISPPRRESSAGASPNLREGLPRGRGKGGAMRGAGAGGHSAVREGSGCKEVKSLASVPKTSYPLGHPARNTTVGEAAPSRDPTQAGGGTQRAVGCEWPWLWGALFPAGAGGRRLCPLPEPGCCCLFVGSRAERCKETGLHKQSPPTLPSLFLIHPCWLQFLLHNGP